MSNYHDRNRQTLDRLRDLQKRINHEERREFSPGSVSAFTALTDSPSSYSGFGGAVVYVNSGATGLAFGPILPGTAGTVVLTTGAQTLNSKTLLSAGSVVVGASAGSALLHVENNGAATAYIRSNSSNPAGMAVERPSNSWGRINAGGASAVSFFYQDGGNFRIIEADSGEGPTSSSFTGAKTRVIVDNSGNMGVGTVTVGGKLHVVQASTTAAIPTLRLQQSDLSEEFVRFDSTQGAGNPIGTAALGAYLAKVRVTINGTVGFLALYAS